MGGLARTRPLAVYYSIAFGLATAVWLYITGMEVALADSEPGGFSLFAHYYAEQRKIVEAAPILHHHTDSVLLYVSTYLVVPVAFAAFFFPFAPTLAGLVTVSLGWGKRALIALLGAYRPVRGNIDWQRGMRIYAAILAMLLVMAGLSVLRVYLGGDVERAGRMLVHLGVIDWRYVTAAWLVALLLNQGALLEELGWRGFALPLAIRKLGSPLAGALLVGTMWTFWHLPREIPTLLSGQQTLGVLVVGQFWFWLMCLSASLVMTYFVNLTGGSVLPAIMIHGGMNFIGGMLASERLGARTAFSAEAPLTWAAAAMVLLILVGRDLGWRERQAAHADGQDPADLWAGPDRRD